MVRVSGDRCQGARPAFSFQGVSFQPSHVVNPHFLAADCVALSKSCPERSGHHTRRGWSSSSDSWLLTSDSCILARHEARVVIAYHR